MTAPGAVKEPGAVLEGKREFVKVIIPWFLRRDHAGTGYPPYTHGSCCAYYIAYFLLHLSVVDGTAALVQEAVQVLPSQA